MRSDISLPLQDFPGTKDQELLNELLPIYNSIRALQSYLAKNLGAGIPDGSLDKAILSNASAVAGKLAPVYAIALVAMVPGTLVHFTATVDGKLAVTPSSAGATDPFEAQAIVATGLAVLPNQLCKVLPMGMAQLQYDTTPFAAGQFLYLSTNPNGLVEPLTSNITSATIKQRIGFALDAFTDSDNNKWQNIWFNPNYGINVI